MLKKIVGGLMVLGLSALPALADENAPMTLQGREEICLSRPEVISGTYQGEHMGQILMRTSDGKDIELPSMTLFWYGDPSVRQADLKVGDELTVVLPEDAQMRIIQNEAGDRVVLGDFEGVHQIPQETVTSWQIDEMEAASR